jgi:predicted ribosomally synthesized peptide with nif11-like leader
MSQVQAFYEALTKDKTFQEEAKALNSKAAENDEATIAKVIIDFAKSKGYSFTAEEYKEFSQKQTDELNMAELNAVAGGGGWNAECFCILGGGGPGGKCACVLGGGGKGGPVCILWGSDV